MAAAAAGGDGGEDSWFWKCGGNPNKKGDAIEQGNGSMRISNTEDKKSLPRGTASAELKTYHQPRQTGDKAIDLAIEDLVNSFNRIASVRRFVIRRLRPRVQKDIDFPDNVRHYLKYALDKGRDAQEAYDTLVRLLEGRGRRPPLSFPDHFLEPPEGVVLNTKKK